MTGIAGGRSGGRELQELIDGISEGADATWFYEADDAGLGAAYRQRDTKALTTWNDGRRGGEIYGAITNRDELDLSDSALFDRLFDHPADTAAALEGEFFIACHDANDDRFLLISDKLGSRNGYFVPPDEGSFRFATAVAPLVPYVDDPTLDVQAVSDMLLMGYMWGDHTLVSEVRAMRPATVLEVTDGTATADRYWKASYEEAPASGAYLDELADRYRQTVRRMSTTLPSEAGIWLSGGLDSRTTAATLLDNVGTGEFTTLRAYTYDANPPTNDNPRIARDVANRLGIDLQKVPLTAETFGDVFERVIETTDGMVQWNGAANLSPTYGIEAGPSVMMEGLSGELVGDHLYRHHLTDYDSAVESQYHSEASTTVERVTRLLDADVNPLTSFKEEVTATPETDLRKQILDIHFQNYYQRTNLTTDQLMRDQVDTRAAYIDGDYLEWCSRLPQAFRKGGYPIDVTFGTIPYGTSRAKLGLIRRIAPGLTDITYERTKVKPSRPYPIHVVGFLGNVLSGRLRSEPTYGSAQLSDFWIRDESTVLHRRVRGLVDDAASRPLFNTDAVQQIWNDHMSGENDASTLAKITTLEYWIQNHLD